MKHNDRRNLIKRTSTQALENIIRALDKLDPNHEANGGFYERSLDDLYDDVDFELASRHFLRDV